MKLSAIILISAAAISPGYASAQAAQAKQWTAQVTKAVAEGRCEDAKTIALLNGNLDLAERALKLCTPQNAAAPVAQQSRTPEPQKAPDPAPAMAVAPAATTAKVPEGTEVVVRFEDNLSSETSREGDRFSISLAEPVVLAGGVTLPAGLRGAGEVTHSQKKGMMGKPGELYVVRSFETGGVRI